MDVNRLSLVRQRASNLYKKYGLEVPVDLDTIIDRKNIRVKYGENQVGIDGMCQPQSDPPTIILNTEMTFEPRRRFTIAHELGHICIPWHTGVGECSLDDPYIRIQNQQMVNTQELEANVFASELLMPTEWLKQSFVLDTEDLADLVQRISKAANTSMMACFYALENVLPAGEVFFVKTDVTEYWKPFHSVDTEGFYISVVRAIPFYDEICRWKREFKLSMYNVIHYKTMPAPDFSRLNQMYLSCGSDLEALLNAITRNHPISAIPFIDKIIDALEDKYYVIIRIGDVYQRHFHHKKASLRIHIDHDEDEDTLYEYIQNHFAEYGRIDFSAISSMLWIRECWRGDGISEVRQNPNDLLKRMLSDLYLPEEAEHMLHRINGIMSNINCEHKVASMAELYHCAKLRFETDPDFKEFVEHQDYEGYIAGKAASLISKRRGR